VVSRPDESKKDKEAKDKQGKDKDKGKGERRDGYKPLGESKDSSGKPLLSDKSSGPTAASLNRVCHMHALWLRCC
jgi:hypothetical protein